MAASTAEVVPSATATGTAAGTGKTAAARRLFPAVVHRRTPLGISSFILFCFANLVRTVDASNIQCPSSCSCLGYFVDCSRKGLIDVPKDLPSWVEILELQLNDITSVPEEAFRGLTNLKQIDLSHNQIRTLNSSSFFGLSLKELKVHHNRLTEIPYLGSLPNLTVFILHHNEIYNVNGTSLQSLENLKNLDLSFNRIVDLPVGAFPNGTYNLQHLSLNSNRIVTMERGVFDHLKSLEWLKLNKNQLVAIRKDLFRNLTSLKHLELNKNNLRQIEGLSFQGLLSLQVLKLKRNNISQLLDGSFWGLANIKQLHLDYNNLSLITKGWLYGLASLQELTLSHNRITEVEEDGWEFCKRLMDLDLTYNQIETIGKGTFAKLNNLRYLYLDHNRILYIEEGSFLSLSALENLELNNNKISSSIEDTNGAFNGLERLRHLGLSNNRIKSIAKKAFSGLAKLNNLDLTLNPITSIQENSFSSLKHLQELSLNSSNLLCDCYLKWFPIWLSHSRNPFAAAGGGGGGGGSANGVNANCGHPLWMKGTPLMEANLNNFTCDDFPKPYIAEEPKTRIALKGANVTLVCKGATSSTSSSNTTFQWRKDNKPILDATTETYAESKDGEESTVGGGGVTVYVSWLHLRNVQDEDEGRYQCVISNHLGSVYSQKARITVHVFPVMTKTPLNVTVKAGSTARLECAAQGQPQPEIAWQKDGGDDFPAARERRMHVMPTDDVFFIVSVKPSDMGMYTCTAKNAAGVVKANASLLVLETPSFVKPMEDKQTPLGETAVLECMASGSPKPGLNWTKDGGPLLATERHFFTADGQLLIIVQTQMSDAGRYVCEMSNTLGAERDSAYLTVLPGLNSQPGGGGGGAGGNSFDNEDSATTGIIIIAVVCCVVGTSLVWVVIIYQTRKRSAEDYSANANSAAARNEDGGGGGMVNALSPSRGELLAPFHHSNFQTGPPGGGVLDFKGSSRQLFSDSNSEHSSSKDSGTGESAKQSSDELLMHDDDSSQQHHHHHHCHHGGGGGGGGGAALLRLPTTSINRNVSSLPVTGNLLTRGSSMSSMLEHCCDASHQIGDHHHRGGVCDSRSPLLHTFQSSTPPPLAAAAAAPNRNGIVDGRGETRSSHPKWEHPPPPSPSSGYCHQLQYNSNNGMYSFPSLKPPQQNRDEKKEQEEEEEEEESLHSGVDCLLSKNNSPASFPLNRERSNYSPPGGDAGLVASSDNLNRVRWSTTQSGKPFTEDPAGSGGGGGHPLRGRCFSADHLSINNIHENGLPSSDSLSSSSSLSTRIGGGGGGTTSLAGRLPPGGSVRCDDAYPSSLSTTGEGWSLGSLRQNGHGQREFPNDSGSFSIGSSGGEYSPTLSTTSPVNNQQPHPHSHQPTTTTTQLIQQAAPPIRKTAAFFNDKRTIGRRSKNIKSDPSSLETYVVDAT